MGYPRGEENSFGVPDHLIVPDNLFNKKGMASNRSACNNLDYSIVCGSHVLSLYFLRSLCSWLPPLEHEYALYRLYYIVGAQQVVY